MRERYRVGKINPIPVPLSHTGLENIFYYPQQVEMVQSARKAVTGDGICIGLTFKANSFIHPKTARSRDLIEAIVGEVRSHRELKNIAFTPIQINRNTISASHTDNNLIGTPSVAVGLGEYVGGRHRLEGAKHPLHIRDHAVVFDGRKPHSSGLFNGDRWSLVLFVHASWEHTSPAMRRQLIGLGLPCPPSGSTQIAVPAVDEAPSAKAWGPR